MSDRNSPRSFRWLPWLFGVSLLINCGFLGGFVYHRYVMSPPKDRLDRAQHSLALNDAQVAELGKIQDTIRDDARENFRVTRERHKDMVLLLRQEPVNMPALEMHLRATTEPQVAMQRDIILRLLAFRDTLSAEQKAAFNEKIERPGFMLRLAGFPGPMWRPHDCRKGGDRGGPEGDDPPPATKPSSPPPGQ
jgi:uncharacterized membrane protein